VPLDAVPKRPVIEIQHSQIISQNARANNYLLGAKGPSRLIFHCNHSLWASDVISDLGLVTRPVGLRPTKTGLSLNLGLVLVLMLFFWS